MTDPLAASFRFCQQLARRAGKNFYWSFLTLPRAMRRDMCVLYAFMRLTDDLGDDEALPLDARRRALSDWHAALLTAMGDASTPAESGNTVRQARVADGRETCSLWPALADVVRRRGIPQALLQDVIRGVESDLTPHAFATFADLDAYCYLVAGAVGLCCIRIWGYTGELAEQHAINCGAAFQLTNILRDLQEDALRGRVYLPQDELQRFGVTAGDLRDGRRSPGFVRLMEFQTERARGLYARAAPLLPLLSPPGRRVYAAMLGIYGGLLEEIQRRGYDVFSQRVELPVRRKLAIALRNWWRPAARPIPSG